MLVSSHKEACESGFPMEICDCTFKFAKAHLTVLDYCGLVALACNDTKLFVTLWLFWDKIKECYFLIGACGGLIRVPDMDVAQEALVDPNIKKATKVCYVWVTSYCDDNANLPRSAYGA
jgi:hypothetical protein